MTVALTLPIEVPEGPPEAIRLARFLASVGQSALRDLMAEAARPEVRSFAIGMPGTDLFPADDMAAASAEVLRRDPRALQYGLPSRALKARVVEIMRLRGVEARPEQVFLTTGSQQAMDLLARLLLDPGGPVALEETVYDGIQIAVRPLAPRVLPVPTSPEHGIDADALEALLEDGERPAFLYLVPEGHNPMGGSLSLDRRERLVELARRFRLPILEDDAYGLLRYEQGGAPPLKALDERWVLYLGSFSKILAPAFRVGWIVAPEELVPRLSIVKHATDLDTTTFAQRTLAAYLEAGHLPAHLERIRTAYRARRDAMLDALSREMPPGVRWHPPEAGIFVWVWLPRGADATAILRRAIRDEAVAFCPGSAFAVGAADHADHCLRLAFADSSPQEIREGVARLGRVLRSVLRADRNAATG